MNGASAERFAATRIAPSTNKKKTIPRMFVVVALIVWPERISVAFDVRDRFGLRSDKLVEILNVSHEKCQRMAEIVWINELFLTPPSSERSIERPCTVPRTDAV